MTAKRFQIFGDVIEDVQGIIPIILCNNDKQKQKFYNGLNCLNDENEQLKQENKELKKKLESKQRLINAYDNYIKTLKEDGVLE